MTKILFAIHCVFSGFLAGDLFQRNLDRQAAIVLFASLLFLIYHLIVKWAVRRIGCQVDDLQKHFSILENILKKKKDEHN